MIGHRTVPGRAPKRHDHRTCTACGAVLSTYNPKDTCYVHTPLVPVMMRGRRMA